MEKTEDWLEMGIPPKVRYFASVEVVVAGWLEEEGEV